MNVQVQYFVAGHKVVFYKLRKTKKKIWRFVFYRIKQKKTIIGNKLRNSMGFK